MLGSVSAGLPRLVSPRPRAELDQALAALRQTLELPGEFAPEVIAEAERAVDATPVDPATAGVDDLREVEFLTIDPPGSTDLDQALHLERTPDGAVLQYAIADVPAFVTPHGAVDVEARLRAQTLYAADGRIPLYPAELSEGAASLLPDVDRRAYVWRFVLDDGARPVKTTLRRAIVRSRAQWTYADAQKAIDDQSAPESLRALEWFGEQRAQREHERGGASLNVPEAEVVADDGGYELVRRVLLPVEEWSAQVSLLTGMAAAEIMLDGGIGILRTMPPAGVADVEAFRVQTEALGMPWTDDIAYGDYLRGLDRSDPTALAVLNAAGSLFRGAGYVAFDGTSPVDAIQAAIGAPYAHVTAPLRRLVDRWVLVICEALANGSPVPTWARESMAEIPKLMDRSTQKANRLDAATIDRVEAAVLHNRVGDDVTAIVLARRDGGARVQLTAAPVDEFVDGLTAVPGSTVSVRVVRADISTGEVVLAPTPPDHASPQR